MVTQFLVRILSFTMLPKVLQSDQGTHFVNQVIEKPCQQTSMTHLTSSPYRPQPNGKVKRLNRTLIASLAKSVSAQKGDWDGHLPTVLMAYRAKRSSVTGKSPFELLFGHTLRMPWGPAEKWPVPRTVVAGRPVSPSPKPPFQVGDEVWRRREMQCGKLDTLYEGPYQVIFASALNVVLKDPSGRLRSCTAHVDRCKLHHRRDVDG